MLNTVGKKYVKSIVNPWLLKGFSINILDDIFTCVYAKNIRFFHKYHYKKLTSNSNYVKHLYTKIIMPTHKETFSESKSGLYLHIYD